MIKKIIKKIKCISLLMLSLAFMPALAQEFYIDWGGDSAQIHYSPTNTYNAGFPWGGNIYWNNDGDLLTELAIATPLEGSGFSEWLFSAKLSLFYLSLNHLDASTAGIALGFETGYKFLTPIPTNLIFSASLSPNIFNTKKDINAVSQVGVRLQADLSPHLRGNLGYRLYSAQLNEIRFPRKDKVDFEDSVFLGFSLLF